MPARLMGIINCTPDSFSDGGALPTIQSAIAHGEQLVRDGAQILDIGGESTRPGAAPVTLEEEWARIGAVIASLAPRFTVSVDTTKAEIARRALASGARIVNDVSAGLADPEMLTTVAQQGGIFIAMHMRGTPATMARDYVPYADVVGEVQSHLLARVAAARAAGIREVWADPGLGFSKSAEDNWKLTHALHRLVGVGDALVYAASRKRFVKALATEPGSHMQLDDLSSHLSTAAVLAGADVVRVHAPAAHRNALTIAAKILASA